jgi:ankyrin repeat protein
MLLAAAAGDVATVQQLLDRGCPPDACDYDKRTGLMLAAANGHEVRRGLFRALSLVGLSLCVVYRRQPNPDSRSLAM